MKKNITWEIGSKLASSFSVENLLDILLKNRLIKEKETFLHPNLSLVNDAYVLLDKKQLKKAVDRIHKAKEEKEQVIVFGDYDVDGITGTAILWETLNAHGVKVSPYIPSRVDEGYGLSVKGVENILLQVPDTKLIITVDNGIVAHEAVDFANSRGVNVIITDHHVVGKTLPDAFSIIHTTLLCGAGVAWMLSKKFDIAENDHLALVALATVADLVPLTHANRIVLSEGLKVLHKTKRPGIVALCNDAGIKQEEIGVYEIGHMLAPRINAMGRISNAMDSLRLLCTKDRLRAKVLAEKLSITNHDRQLLTQSLSLHAINVARDAKHNILFVSHENYDEGVIGLMAGKMVETYYRPSIVIARKENISKASARSVAGFNIIEFIRLASHLLINAGGHPMAAGFTLRTEKIEELQKFVEKQALNFDESLLTKKLKIDCELPLEYVSQELYDKLQILQPFGMGNPEPVFKSTATILSIKKIGKEKNHLSLQVVPSYSSSKVRSSQPSAHHPKVDSGSSGSPIRSGMTAINAIAFGIGERFKEFRANQKVEIVYTLSENEWNNKKSLQLKIRDIK